MSASVASANGAVPVGNAQAIGPDEKGKQSSSADPIRSTEAPREDETKNSARRALTWKRRALERKRPRYIFDVGDIVVLNHENVTLAEVDERNATATVEFEAKAGAAAVKKVVPLDDIRAWRPWRTWDPPFICYVLQEDSDLFDQNKLAGRALVKVGITNDLSTRLLAYKTHNPHAMRIIGLRFSAVRRTMRATERLLKQQLAPWRHTESKGTEWFLVPTAQLHQTLRSNWIIAWRPYIDEYLKDQHRRFSVIWPPLEVGDDDDD